MNILHTISALALALMPLAPRAQTPQLHNPMMWADVPDPDVIRVDSTFYLVSTTMHLMPGGPVYQSKDLAHWTLASYLFPTLDNSPYCNLDGGTIYGCGQWATSLKYHEGTFYALFCTNDPVNGDSYIFSTKDPRQGWQLHSRIAHLHDPSLFFDDDGRVYVFHGSGHLTELQPDLKGIKEGGTDCQVIERDEEETALLEGSRVIKKDGKYYALMISWPEGKPRRQLCYRADNITGPYEKRVILEDNFAGFPYVGQGTIVDAPDGSWYGVIFQDRGAVGRVLTVEPCRWEDGWPILGDANGKVPATMALPVDNAGWRDEAESQPLVVDDDFSGEALKWQWQWNHNPIDDAWSLTERKGWLRLKTSKVVENLFAAPNTLSQRTEGPACEATVCLDISRMRDGDRAGFAAFNGHAAVLTIERNGKQYALTAQAQTVSLDGPQRTIARVDVEEWDRLALKEGKVWLRIHADFRLHRDKATLAYSLDGKAWHAIGREFQMRYDYTRLFMGTRLALFCYATKAKGGCVDVDFFDYKKETAHFSYFKYEGNDTRFDKPIDRSSQYFNPILAGFYPDPAICRKGDTYYLVNSSFAFFPGVPLFESKDLANWTQVGHVLDRPSQLPLEGQGVSGGIFAPDIKYCERNKTFYMLTTNVGRGNFFVKSKDPAKGWGEPIYLPQIDGIDPSFCFDDKAGRAFIVHNAPVMGGDDYEGQRVIRIMEFDIKGDSIIGQPKEIVRGGTHVEAKPIWIEGPHLYRIGKYYYLMCAEGGTGDWHSEVIFRASAKADITQKEAWEECPHNPILTQRTGLDPNRPDIVTSTGHADLVQTPGGDWYAVFLGCRAYDGPYYNTGRDTYLLPVTWRDGWPTILEGGVAVPTVATATHKLGTPAAWPTTGNFGYTDRFDSPTLSPRWLALRNPSAFYTVGQGLDIAPKAVSIAERQSPSALFARQQHEHFTAETSVSFDPATDNDLAGFTLLQNEEYNFVFGVTRLGGKPAITLTRSEKSTATIASALIDGTSDIRLKIVGRGRYYDFLYATPGAPWQVLAKGVDAVNLSTARSGGFIGACIGLYATSKK